MKSRRTCFSIKALTLLPFILSLALPAAAALFDPQKDVLIKTTWHQVEQEKLELSLFFRIPQGIHITKNELFSITTEPGAARIIRIKYPASEKWKKDLVYRNDFLVRLILALERTAPSLDVKVRYQCCDEKKELCYLPSMQTLQVIVPAGENKEPSLPALFRKALKEDLLLAFLLVFLAGILASLSPCVYPMIPLTIGYIGARSEGGRLKGFILSLFFVLGLSITYSGLGLLAAATGSVFGSLTQTPLTTFLIGLIFILMAGSMFGLFNLQLPSVLLTRLQTGRKKGYPGALFVGMATGLLAVPCVGPVVISLLAWIAQSRSFFLGFALLFFFTWGMGVLFILIGTFAGFVRSLPRTGPWTEMVKYLFGMFLLVAGYYYLHIIWSGAYFYFALGIGMVLFGSFIVPHMVLLKKSLSTAVKVILVLSGTLIILWTGYHQYLSSGKLAAGHIFQIIDDDEKAFQKARQEKKPVFMDFYADWCMECREMEQETFPDPEIKKLLKGYVTVRMDLTKRTKQTEAVSKKYRVLSLPTMVLFDPQAMEKKRFFGFYSPDELAPALK